MSATMNAINLIEIERETQRMSTNRDELVERMERATRVDGPVEPLPGLHLHRASAPTKLVRGVSTPGFCVIAQGSKEVFLGDDRYQYDPAHYLLATVQLPTTAQIIEASPDRPYLSLRLDLNLPLVGSIMVESGHLSPSRADVISIAVSPRYAGLQDTVVRFCILES